MKNKHAQVGDVIMLFVATVAIAIILMFFILGSGLVKKMIDSEGGLVVYAEKGVEIDNVFNYSDRYERLVKARFFIERGSSLDKSIQEANYER
ncbi:MAG: hypothetical protein OEL87_03380 [Nanoarchaeota archaeon]|nr:hypothetical protein [Nanoarchaeota archaeon]